MVNSHSMGKKDMQDKEVGFRLKERKLNYRFHNPNSAEDTADFLCKLLIEVNADKVERAIEEATKEADINEVINA